MAKVAWKRKRTYYSGSCRLHLCYNVAQGFYLTDGHAYADAVAGPRFQCEHCGRVAHWHGNLCVPEHLDDAAASSAPKGKGHEEGSAPT
jgi:hypothetical protein